MNCDMVAVNLGDQSVRLLAQNITEQIAETIITLAILSWGVEKEIYAKVAVGMYKDGDV